MSRWRYHDAITGAVGVGLALASCGRIGFDPGAAITFDAAPPPLGAFEMPTRIDELSSSSEDDDPTLTDDRLEIYFTSSRSGGSGSEDLWRATRASTADPWGAPSPAAELNTVDSEQTPELAADGMTMYFARGTVSEHDIYVTTRTDRATAWSPPVRVAELSSGDDDTAPAISPDGLVMVLTRGSVMADAALYLLTRATTAAAWTAPVRIALDAASTTENQAWLASDVMYYTSNVPGLQGIRRAARTGPTTFGPSEPVNRIDLPGDESDPWLDSTQRVIFFEHEDDLYWASR